MTESLTQLNSHYNLSGNAVVKQKKNLILIIFEFQGDSPFGKTEAYIKLEQLGEGSYATVYKGYSK